MEFVINFTPANFQAKDFTPPISPNFNSFSEKKHKKWVKMEKFTLLAKILHCHRQWQQWQISPLSDGGDNGDDNADDDDDALFNPTHNSTSLYTRWTPTGLLAIDTEKQKQTTLSIFLLLYLMNKTLLFPSFMFSLPLPLCIMTFTFQFQVFKSKIYL